MEVSFIDYLVSKTNEDIFQQILLHVPIATILASSYWTQHWKKEIENNEYMKHNILNNEYFWKQKLLKDFGYTKEHLCSLVDSNSSIDLKNKSCMDLCRLCETKLEISIECMIDIFRSYKTLRVQCYSDTKNRYYCAHKNINVFSAEAKHILDQEFNLLLKKENVEFVALYHIEIPEKLIGLTKEDIPVFYEDWSKQDGQYNFTAKYMMLYYEICTKLFKVYDVEILKITYPRNLPIILAKISKCAYMRIYYSGENGLSSYLYWRSHDYSDGKPLDVEFDDIKNNIIKQFNLSSIEIDILQR